MNIKKHPFLYIIFIISIFISLSFSSFGQMSEKEKKTVSRFINEANNYINNDNIKEAANSYYKAGLYCFEKNLSKKAIPYLKESANLYGKNKDFKKVMTIYSNIGLIYSNLDEYDKSLLYFKQSLKIRRSIGNEKDIASGMLDLAYILSVQQDYKNAILNILKALDIANKIQEPKLVLISYNMLAENYQKAGNMQKAAEYMDKFATYRKHYEKSQSKERFSEERIKTAAEISMKNSENRAKQLELELIRKNKEIAEDTLNRKIRAREDSLAIAEAKIALEKSKFEQAEKDRLLAESKSKAEKAQQRLIYAIGIAIIVVILLVAFILVLNIRRRKRHNLQLQETNDEIEKQKRNIELKNNELTDAFNKIEEQNNDINASINYAVNIQSSMLPSQSSLQQMIPESFILFKPRDKVSGDFYWFKDTIVNPGKADQHKKIFVSAIDCTGHGIPGAFLSMLSYNLLDNIIEQQNIFKPGEILDELHKGVRKSLRQNESKNRDGMDMALCSYNPENNMLEFSGAKNPVIYIKDNKLHRVKGSIKPIGGILYDKNESIKFKTTNIEIDSPTTVYIFSDGYADQIGEQTGRKLMTRFFRNLLGDIHNKPLHEQKDILDMFLKKWQGNLEQVDDIVIIGFKLFPQ